MTYRHTCQVRVTVGNSGLCYCSCVKYFERWLTPLCVDTYRLQTGKQQQQTTTTKNKQQQQQLQNNNNNNWKQPHRPPTAAFVCSTASRLRVKTHFVVRTGHINYVHVTNCAHNGYRSVRALTTESALTLRPAQLEERNTCNRTLTVLLYYY